MNYNELAKQIHDQNKAVGWWDNPDRCKLTLLQLVSTEIAEATEAERKDLMDDHLPHRKGGEVELADALIRLLDMGGAYGWQYDHNNNEFEGAKSATKFKDLEIGGKHYVLTMITCSIGLAILEEDGDDIAYSYSLVIDMIQETANSQGYDIESALHEKLAYNKERQDHKRENRVKEGGKKF